MDNVRPGQRKIRADALNDAIQGGRVATGTRVRGGKQSQIPGAGQIIDATKRDKRKLIPIGTVRPVIVRKSPSPTAGWVRVQMVRYSNWPVQPCTDSGCNIGIAGPEFDVRPYYGKKDSAYKEYEVVGDTLDISKTFFNILWDGKQWIIEAPKGGGSSVSPCLIHASTTGVTDPSLSWGGGRFIRIVHVKFNSDTGLWVTAETQGGLGYSLATCWPGTLDNFWKYGQSTRRIGNFDPPIYGPTTTAKFFAAMMIGGVEYIAPVVPISMFTPDATRQAGDC